MKWRLLNHGELIEIDDEFYSLISHKWENADRCAGNTFDEADRLLMRRKVSPEIVEGFHAIITKYRDHMWSSEQHVMDNIESFIS